MADFDFIISTAEGDMHAYVAKPDGQGPFPGILVIQEIFGVNDVMKSTCEWLADQGYLAICPDLFWRIEPGISLTDQSEAEMKRAFDLFGQFDIDLGVKDIQSALAALRMREDCNTKAGAVGYCLGGLLAYLTAARTDVDAAVGYYGVRIQDFLSESANIKRPLLLHIAGQDEFVPTDAQSAMADGLAGHAMVTIKNYPERDHAFARQGGAHFHAADAETANAATLTLLDGALRG